jgi:hypothetical protein
VLRMRTVFPNVSLYADESHPAQYLIPPVGFAFAYDSRQALPVQEGAGMPVALQRGSVAGGRRAS